MAFIQCSLSGTALSMYIRLNDTDKKDLHAFVQAFKKQFSSQKNSYYAQVEALYLVEKANETVRHFALKIQQISRILLTKTSETHLYCLGSFYSFSYASKTCRCRKHSKG